MEKACKNCNSVFYKKYTYSRKYWGNQKYCSYKCYWIALKDYQVSDEIKRKRTEAVKRLGLIPPHFFGKDSSHWKGGGGELVCLHCYNVFPVSHSKLKVAKFCSQKCKIKHMDFGLTPISMRIRKSKEYIKWYKNIFRRDQYTCQICGEVGGTLNAHHIRKFSKYIEHRFELNNGITLCKNCHYKMVNHKEDEWVSYFNFNLESKLLVEHSRMFGLDI